MYIRHISRPSLAALAVAALIVPIVAGSSAALAQGVNFKGKKITFWTPHRGADSILSLKTWSKYMSKHLPGNPEITVKSKFGGGGVTNANFFNATAKPNGLTASMHNLPVFISYAIKRKGVKYDPTKFPVLAAEPNNYIGIAGKASGVKSVGDFKGIKRTLTFGTRTRNFNVMMASIIWQSIGNPLKVTPGFGGDSTITQALGSGELELGYVNYRTFLKHGSTYKNLGINGLYQVGDMTPAGKIVRSKLLPQLPTALEVFKNFNPNAKGTPEMKAMVAASGMWQFGKAYFLPKGTPANIVSVWRAAVHKAANDPAFAAAHIKLLGGTMPYVPHQQAAKIISDSLATLATPFFQKGGEGYKMAVGSRRRGKGKRRKK